MIMMKMKRPMNYEYTPMERLYDDTRNHSYIGEFNPPASFSGQFSPSEDLNGESATSQGDFTGATELYHDDVPLSNIVILPTSIAEIVAQREERQSRGCVGGTSFSDKIRSGGSVALPRPPRPSLHSAVLPSVRQKPYF
jgi:hypothetical protein